MRPILFVHVLGLIFLSTITSFAAEGPPNVVLIFADDLGYGDLGCYGATKVQTPNIDRLAAEGRRFTDAHSVSAVCTPSRYALLTGQYPVRASDGRGVWGPAPITSELIVDTKKATIADVFKNAGYATGVIGKWHLGFGKEENKWQEPLRPGPLDLGFDYYFGMPVVNSAPPYVYVENDRVVGSDPTDPLVYLGRNAKGATPITPIPPEAARRSPNEFAGAKKAHQLFNDYQVGTTFAKKSVEWISERKDKPFFLYLATTNIHHPFTPAKRFQGTSQCGLYGDFIHELDWIVGEVMTCLENNGVADNTLGIFTSDNDEATGGWGHITADNFQFDAKVLDEYPILKTGNESRQKSQPETSKPAEPAGDVSSSNPENSRSPKPNFVVIFTDDQGYGDLSCYGAAHVSTPRIDQMATEGSRLTSFYVAAPVCTPSRAGLMTGCYPKRVGMATGSNFGVLLAGDSKGLNPKEVTIAEVLKSAGYRTGMFGKWHLGDQPEFLPTRQGFDEFFGLPFSHDIHPFHPRQDKHNFPPLPLLDNETVIEMDPDADYLTKRITERAVSFIQENKDAPFFLYVPHPIPHAPLHVSPPFMEGVADDVAMKLKEEDGNIDYRTRDKLFRQAIAEIDWSVGTILDAIKANGLDERTLVIFTSDNGPPKNTLHASPGPLRGHKGTTFEGGMREPTVIRWPGRIPAGKDNSELMTAMDLLPTFAKLAGAEIPRDRVIDGKDIWPTLAGESATPHEAFFYHRGTTLAAVRSGKWKLHTNRGRPAQLYNLDDDIGEQKNVIKSHPEVVKQLNERLTDFAKDIAANSRPAAFVENPKPLSK